MDTAWHKKDYEGHQGIMRVSFLNVALELKSGIKAYFNPNNLTLGLNEGVKLKFSLAC